MRHLLLAAGLSLAAPLGTAPASAEGPGVVLSYTSHVQELDRGHVVVVLCNATADPERPGEDVALATVVTCTVSDGTNVERGNQGMPGSEAVAPVVINVVTEQVEVCLWGEAAFARVTANALAFPTATRPCEYLRLPA
jgi:hypothetical protein